VQHDEAIAVRQKPSDNLIVHKAVPVAETKATSRGSGYKTNNVKDVAHTRVAGWKYSRDRVKPTFLTR
jgi:hypothetical protein